MDGLRKVPQILVQLVQQDRKIPQLGSVNAENEVRMLMGVEQGNEQKLCAGNGMHLRV